MIIYTVVFTIKSLNNLHMCLHQHMRNPIKYYSKPISTSTSFVTGKMKITDPLSAC